MRLERFAGGDQKLLLAVAALNALVVRACARFAAHGLTDILGSGLLGPRSAAPATHTSSGDQEMRARTSARDTT